jgi:hypothetical protein
LSEDLLAVRAFVLDLAVGGKRRGEKRARADEECASLHRSGA